MGLATRRTPPMDTVTRRMGMAIRTHIRTQACIHMAMATTEARMAASAAATVIAAAIMAELADRTVEYVAAEYVAAQSVAAVAPEAAGKLG